MTDRERLERAALEWTVSATNTEYGLKKWAREYGAWLLEMAEKYSGHEEACPKESPNEVASDRSRHEDGSGETMGAASLPSASTPPTKPQTGSPWDASDITRRLRVGRDDDAMSREHLPNCCCKESGGKHLTLGCPACEEERENDAAPGALEASPASGVPVKASPLPKPQPAPPSESPPPRVSSDQLDMLVQRIADGGQATVWAEDAVLDLRDARARIAELTAERDRLAMDLQAQMENCQDRVAERARREALEEAAVLCEENAAPDIDGEDLAKELRALGRKQPKEKDQ